MALVEKTVWLDDDDIEDLLVKGMLEPDSGLVLRLDRSAEKFLQDSEKLRDKEAMEQARKEVLRERNT